MQTAIDLGTELLIDRSRISTPYLRLLIAAIGQPMAQGSPWVAIDKQVALLYALPLQRVVPAHDLSAVA